jgi:hypothetical protein
LRHIKDSENNSKESINLNEFEILFKRNINANISIDDNEENEELNVISKNLNKFFFIFSILYF